MALDRFAKHFLLTNIFGVGIGRGRAIEMIVVSSSTLIKKHVFNQHGIKQHELIFNA